MKSINKVVHSCVFLSLVLFSGCGGGSSGGSSSSTENKISISGIVVDGYIKWANVFFDLDNNGIFDEGEPSTMTNELGKYSFSNISEISINTRLIAYGGFDSTTGKEFKGILKNIYSGTGDIDSLPLTPATTLVAYMVNDTTPVEVARQKVATFLSLQVDDLDKDPIAEFDTNPDIYKQNLKVIKMIETIQQVESGVLTKDNANSSFVKYINNINNDTLLNISNYNDQNIDLGTYIDQINTAINAMDILPEDGEGYGEVDAVIATIAVPVPEPEEEVAVPEPEEEVAVPEPEEEVAVPEPEEEVAVPEPEEEVAEPSIVTEFSYNSSNGYGTKVVNYDGITDTNVTITLPEGTFNIYVEIVDGNPDVKAVIGTLKDVSGTDTTDSSDVTGTGSLETIVNSPANITITNSSGGDKVYILPVSSKLMSNSNKVADNLHIAVVNTTNSYERGGILSLGNVDTNTLMMLGVGESHTWSFTIPDTGSGTYTLSVDTDKNINKLMQFNIELIQNGNGSELVNDSSAIGSFSQENITLEAGTSYLVKISTEAMQWDTIGKYSIKLIKN